jgi:ribosomal subunit interface protein
MQLPLQITFRNLDASPAIEARIRDRAGKLERYCGHITSCRVAVEALHKHHQHGNKFHVRVDVTAPGAELVANREPDEHHAYSDVFVAIRDAFDTMRRQLEDYERRRGRSVKAHAVPAHGRIAELNAEDGYGRIETAEGRLVYFHRNSLVSADFDQLRTGAEVRFDEEPGERGPQASSVTVVGKHHIVG